MMNFTILIGIGIAAFILIFLFGDDDEGATQ